MLRGASGEAAGRLVKEKVGVTAGIVTGALDFSANVLRKSCAQPGSAVMSVVICGTVAAGHGITVGVEVGGARGMSSGRSVPGVDELVGVGALPTLDTRGVLDLDCLVLTVTGVPTNGWSSPWMTLKYLIRLSIFPKSLAVKSAG